MSPAAQSARLWAKIVIIGAYVLRRHELMSEYDYLLAWNLYVLAALGCLLVGFQLTSWLWRWLREPLRVVMAVLLFTPTLIDPAHGLYAPSIAVAALDLLFRTGNNLWMAATDLASFALIGAALYLVFVAIRWPLERRRAAQKAEHDAQLQQRLERIEAESSLVPHRREPRI